jgi:hemerythrin-like metal-binding protein
MSVDLATGHPEIDRQHEKLAQMIDGLETVCEAKRQTGEPCLQCRRHNMRICGDRIIQLISDLLVFMLDHFTYEEKLMRLLPDTEESRVHIEGHQFAHAEVSRLLSDLTADLDRENPRQTAIHLRNILNAWLGKHSTTYDATLAISLDGAYDVEMDYDRELTKLLNR